MAFKEEENMFVAFQVIMTIVKINCGNKSVGEIPNGEGERTY